MKIQFTILLFFICTCSLLANRPAEANTSDDINTTIVAQGNDTSAMSPSTITDESGGGGLSTYSNGSINSILGYSILIFFSVLIIIMIDNRNLERRYKKLATDFKNKDPLL